MKRKNLTKQERSKCVKRISKLIKFSADNGFKAVEVLKPIKAATAICKSKCVYYIRVDSDGNATQKGGVTVSKDLYYEFEL